MRQQSKMLHCFFKRRPDVVVSFDVVHVFVLQKAYREESKKEAGCSLYAQMPQTIETVFAKELSKTQSDVSLTLPSQHQVRDTKSIFALCLTSKRSKFEIYKLSF